AAAPVDQLLLFTPGSQSLLIANHIATRAFPQAQASYASAHLAVTNAVVDVLPLRLNADALSDLAMLSNDAQGVTFALSAPQTVFTVTNNNDSGPGSLRQAMLDANARQGADVIQFNLPVGARTITPQTTLPPLADAVTLDATTQPDFAGAPL